VTAPLRITNLIKDYGPLRAVNNVSLEMKPGEVFGLLGPNGAGKTSIISCLVTLEEPTSGTCEIFGYDVQTHPKQAKMHVGFMPQEIINHGYFTVREILEFHSGYYGLPRNGERIDFLLNKMSLTKHQRKKVKALSGGMKRRLLIAKALVHNPKILLLDEPTAGVDIELRSSLWEFVEELRSEGISILLTTHYIEEAERLCDRVGILQEGRLKRLGETKDLIRDLTKRTIRLTITSRLGDVSHKYLKLQNDQELVFTVPHDLGVGDLLRELKLKSEEVKDLHIEEGNLEEALKFVLEENA
jgi:ABC-2 type transport system ATP-binding protein